jgi:rod shape-determining protein MreD
MIGTGIKWFIGLALCLALQTTVMRVVAIADITPDLLMIALFLLGIRAGVVPGIYVGFLIGLGQDLYTPAILGQTALAKTLTGLFVGLFNEKLMRTDPLMKLIILLVSFLLHDLVFTIVTIVKIDASFGMLIPELFTRTLPRALYSAAFAALVYAYESFVKPSLRR